jgi:hypothetical protein
MQGFWIRECTRIGGGRSALVYMCHVPHEAIRASVLLSDAKVQKPAVKAGFLLVRDVLGAVAVGRFAYSSFNGFGVEERHQLARVRDALNAAIELRSLGDRQLLMHHIAANFGGVMQCDGDRHD